MMVAEPSAGASARPGGTHTPLDVSKSSDAMLGFGAGGPAGSE